jgi:hypothetical protein
MVVDVLVAVTVESVTPSPSSSPEQAASVSAARRASEQISGLIARW